MAQLVGHMTPDFGSGPDLRVVKLRTSSDSALGVGPA